MTKALRWRVELISLRHIAAGLPLFNEPVGDHREEIEMERATRKLICENLDMDEEGEPEEGVSGERPHGIPGFRVYGQTVHALKMAPGDRVASGFTLENPGLEPIRVVVTAGVVSDNGLCQALLLSLLLARQDSSGGSGIIYYGSLTELYRQPDRGLSLSAEGSERLIWSVYFPFESGSEYQALQCQVDFVFKDQQM